MRNADIELAEAISAGEAARETVERILTELNKAHGWGVWDLLGGGFISHLVKHDHLDHAQALMGKLEAELERFRKELGDIRFRADCPVNIEGFLRFADWFMDGFLADFAVLSRINESRDRLRSLRGELDTALDQLYALQERE